MRNHAVGNMMTDLDKLAGQKVDERKHQRQYSVVDFTNNTLMKA